MRALRLAVGIATLLSATFLGRWIGTASAAAPPQFRLLSVPSGSMIPTIDIGDQILVDEQVRAFGEGAIIVFAQPARDTMCGPAETDLVKRIVALPGQTIWSVGNAIYVNGHVLREPYLTTAARTDLGPPIERTTVPKNDLYVLGDNRSISCDSRYWGPVPARTIVGQAFMVCSPTGSCRPLSPTPGDVKL